MLLKLDFEIFPDKTPVLGIFNLIWRCANVSWNWRKWLL